MSPGMTSSTCSFLTRGLTRPQRFFFLREKGTGVRNSCLTSTRGQSHGLDAELCSAARVVWDCSSSSSNVQHDIFNLWVCRAAGRGHLPLIRTALSIRPGLATVHSYRFLQQQAAEGGCQDVLQWLEGLRAGGGGGGAAADASVLGTWQWSDLKAALRNGDLAAATFLVGHGVELPPDALTQAAAEGVVLSAVQWLAGQWAAAGAVKAAEVRRAMDVAKDRGVREWLGLLLQMEEDKGQVEGEGGVAGVWEMLITCSLM